MHYLAGKGKASLFHLEMYPHVIARKAPNCRGAAPPKWERTPVPFPCALQAIMLPSVAPDNGD